MRFNQVFDYIRTITIFTVILCAIWMLYQKNIENFQGVPRIVDGDSMKFKGREIRLLGIDAPEYDQTCTTIKDGSSFSCGKSAREYLIKLVDGNKVFCEGFEQDKYDRMLSVCMRESLNLNRQMVLDGWALAFGDYYEEEAEAQKAGRGLWAGEFQTPSQWRKNKKQENEISWFSRLINWFYN